MAQRRIAGVRLACGRYKFVCDGHDVTPEEVWRFRTARAAVSPAHAAPSPEQAAQAFLSADTELLERGAGLAGLCKRRMIRGPAGRTN